MSMFFDAKNVANDIIANIVSEIRSGSQALLDFLNTPFIIQVPFGHRSNLDEIFDLLLKSPNLARMEGLYKVVLQAFEFSEEEQARVGELVSELLDKWSIEKTGKPLNPETKSALVNELVTAQVLAILSEDPRALR